MHSLREAVNELRSNERQWDAFSSTGHTVVLAPPGSGKTKLLTTRLARDLATGLIRAPQGAACITMTNEATGELRRRLADLGVRWRANLFVGTVHAFALSAIVIPFARPCGRPFLAESELASASEQDLAFDRAAGKILGSNRDDPDLRRDVDRFRRLGPYSADLDLNGTEIAHLARAYERELEAQGVYDFNDIMRHAIEMLGEHAWLRRVLTATFPEVYVDEYQDLPPSLHALVEMLCFDEGAESTLFAVGDPDQAIYGFLGTRPDLLTKLANRSGVHSVELEINYRCANDIVEASLRALGEPRKIRGITDGGEILIDPRSDGPDGQRERAVELVRAALGEGVDLDQILVLTQGNDERDEIVAYLRAADVPVFARSDRHYRATPLTLAIEGLAFFSATEPRPFVELSEVLDDWESALLGRTDHVQLTALVSLLQKVTGAVSARDFMDSLGPLGLDRVIGARRRFDDAREVQRMRTAFGPEGELATSTVRNLGDRARASGRVMAATLHGAKGLEFDVVVVCDVEEGRMPHWGSINSADPAGIEEDRRKFYVALTRARHRVHLIWAGWRISRAGNPYNINISRFALDLVEDDAGMA